MFLLVNMEFLIQFKALLTGPELDDENFTTVARDELRFLREKATRADELVEENTRLANELNGYDEAARRVEALDKENKRLTGALEKAIQQQKLQNVGTPGGPQTPGPSEPPSSVRKIEDGEATAASREKYNTLVAKYNAMFANFNETRSANRHLQESLDKEKRKNKDWNKKWGLHIKDHDNKLAQKDEKIQRQDEDIGALRAKLDGHEAAPKLHALELRDINSTRYVPASVIQVTRSPMKLSAEDTEQRNLIVQQCSVSQPASLGQPEEDGNRADSPELPNLLKEGHFNVDDTQFIPLEADHSSSTQDEPPSPNKAGAEAKVAKEQPPTEHPPSDDDVPVIMSARSVKKRKTRHDNVELNPVPKVKPEKLDSSPISLVAFKYGLNESIDLDDIGEKVDTPKKRRHMLELSRQASRLSNETNSQQSLESPIQGQNNIAAESVHGASQDTPVRRIRVSRAGSALQPLSTNSRVLPRTSDDRPPKKRRLASDKAVEDLAEDGVSTQERTPKRPAGDGTERLGGLLQKPSPPKRVLSPVHLTRTDTPKVINQHTRSKASATSGLAHELRNPNGYDSDGGASARSRRSRESVEPSRPSSKGTPRVSAEPTRPSPRHLGHQVEQLSKYDRSQPKTPISRSRPTSRDSINSVGPSRPPSSKGLSRNPPENAKSSAKSKQRSRVGETEPEWDDNPDNEPLRTRPVQTLNLEDFKINPNYNQGYDYAFNEVVRSNDARRCLQGCTRPDCCGNQLRALAELSVDNGGPRTMSQEERDDELLSDFMGGNAYKIANMSAAEKKEKFLQAKTWDLANKNGRHRHAYERRKSPPGFWETDFPTTQEEMVNREKSKAFMRELVQQRYDQAMRPGGAYIFRDE
jgi:hypothetical protein